MPSEVPPAGAEPAAEPLADRVVLLECNVDDMTGEALAYALDRLLAEGALDAWFCPLQMKKGRPGTLVAVLSTEEQAAHLRNVMLRETTTLGVRWCVMNRQIAGRRTERVDTPFGRVRVKVKTLDGCDVSAKPEYDDCAALARQAGVPFATVQEAAAAAARALLGIGSTSSEPGAPPEAAPGG